MSNFNLLAFGVLGRDAVDESVKKRQKVEFKAMPS